MSRRLKVGDVVRHKTGGPTMLVESVAWWTSEVAVSWWDHAEQCFYEELFPAACLEVVS